MYVRYMKPRPGPVTDWASGADDDDDDCDDGQFVERSKHPRESDAWG